MMPEVLFDTISFRPVQPEDQPFLCDLYASTRWEEMSSTGWDDDQIRAFLRSQFILQHQHYQKSYTNAQFQIICRNGRDIGRIYRETTADEIQRPPKLSKALPGGTGDPDLLVVDEIGIDGYDLTVLG